MDKYYTFQRYLKQKKKKNLVLLRYTPSRSRLEGDFLRVSPKVRASASEGHLGRNERTFESTKTKKIGPQSKVSQHNLRSNHTRRVRLFYYRAAICVVFGACGKKDSRRLRLSSRHRTVAPLHPVQLSQRSRLFYPLPLASYYYHLLSFRTNLQYPRWLRSPTRHPPRSNIYTMANTLSISPARQKTRP